MATAPRRRDRLGGATLNDVRCHLTLAGAETERPQHAVEHGGRGRGSHDDRHAAARGLVQRRGIKDEPAPVDVRMRAVAGEPEVSHRARATRNEITPGAAAPVYRCTGPPPASRGIRRDDVVGPVDNHHGRLGRFVHVGGWRIQSLRGPRPAHRTCGGRDDPGEEPQILFGHPAVGEHGERRPDAERVAEGHPQPSLAPAGSIISRNRALDSRSSVTVEMAHTCARRAYSSANRLISFLAGDTRRQGTPRGCPGLPSTAPEISDPEAGSCLMPQEL